MKLNIKMREQTQIENKWTHQAHMNIILSFTFPHYGRFVAAYFICCDEYVMLQDMYEKMVQIDPNAPTEEEHRLKGVTKPRLVHLCCVANDFNVGQEDTKMGT